MASNRPSIAPGGQPNSPPKAVNNAQQRTPYYDSRRGQVATVDDTVKHVRFVIEKNQELKSLLAALTEKTQQLESEREKVVAETLKAAQMKTEDDVKEKYEIKLAESLKNYEDAKVVVLTYKTQNIRLQSLAEHNEAEITRLMERVKVNDLTFPFKNLGMAYQ